MKMAKRRVQEERKKAEKELLKVPAIPNSNEWTQQEIQRKFAELPELDKTTASKMRITREVISL